MNKNQKIECKPYKATFYTDTVCIKNQIKIEIIKSQKREKRESTYEVLFTAPPPAYYRIKLCDGCEIGERLYQKAKKENRLDDYIEKHKQRINKKISQKLKEYIYLQKTQIDSLSEVFNSK